MNRFAIIAFFLFFYSALRAQFDFCTGSKGDPIFLEDFGNGTNYGPALAPGLTSYSFVSGVPDDGSYTLYNSTFMNANWINIQDHTPNDTNGKALIVNASFSAGEFYRRKVSGLCINTTFEFTAWLVNAYNPANQACPGTGIPINVKFQIWDETETTLLTQMDTGDIQGNPASNWQQFGLTFTTLNQTEVVLKMINNGVGGCGNDLAIDDIMFRSCGDITTIQAAAVNGSEYFVCSANLPVNLTLNVNIPDPAAHVFQWQSSTDEINWSDIAGETSAAFNTPAINTSTSFRVKVAQDIANIGNAFCYTLSEPFAISIIAEPAPPSTSGDRVICSNENYPQLTASPGVGESINWYNSAAGGTLLLAASTSYTPTGPGTFYAEAYVLNGDCVSPSRTAVSLAVNQAPTLPAVPSVAEICEGNTTTLTAGLANETYLWQPGGQATAAIVVSQGGTYTVTVTNGSLCQATQSFVVTEYFAPEIVSITNDGPTITITTANTGAYEYSLDGDSWQLSNVFEAVAGGLITAYVRETHGCGMVNGSFLLILPPNYFSPNEDGIHDVFAIPGFSYIPNSQVGIFDRFGKLVKTLTQESPYWDGKLNGKPLPADDYWYHAEFSDGTDMRGHFALIR